MQINQSDSDLAIAILQNTRDGELLAPRDLVLLQLAVNRELSDIGEEAFQRLYRQVCIEKSYCKDKVWAWGIENVTRDHEGYVYWRGHYVEHFSYADAHDAKRAASVLSVICQRMDSAGIEVRAGSYMRWHGLMQPEVERNAATLLDLDACIGFYKSMMMFGRPAGDHHIKHVLTAMDVIKEVAGKRLLVRFVPEHCCDPTIVLAFRVASDHKESARISGEMAALRKALVDDAEAHECISAISRLSYFVSPNGCYMAMEIYPSQVNNEGKATSLIRTLAAWADARAV